MTHSLRRFVLTAHITASVGWLGAVVVFLALTVAGLTSQDAQMVRVVYLAAQPITRFVIVPFALAALVTGFIQSLATPWGLFRHYWVLFKLLLSTFAAVVLLLYTQTVNYFAEIANNTDTLHPSGLISYLLHSGAALLVLLATTALSVYKPRGMTPWSAKKAEPQGLDKA